MYTLYHNSTSPYVRKVMVLLHETDQLDAVNLVPATGNPLDTKSLPVGQNPLGKLPALERPDGTTLYDSRVICRFFAELNPKGRTLFPAAPRLWEVLTLEATGDGVLDAALLMRYETFVRPEEHQFPDWVEGQWTKIARSLDALESRWMGHLAGPLDMGQIAVGCALGYLDFRLEDRQWRTGRDALAGWYASFAERPSMQATRPK